MLRPLRWTRLLLVLVAAPLLAAPQLAPTPGEDPANLPGPTLDTQRGLAIQPYVQELGQNAFTLRFETTTPLAVTVTLHTAAEGPALAEVKDREVRLHEIRATGLEPGTTYRYRLAFGAAVPLGGGEIRTWPADLSSIRFFAYGDTRTRADEHRKIAEGMAAKTTDHLFVLHTGDLVADGNKVELWKKELFDPAASLFAKVPLMAVAGNHERGSDLYRSYLSLPESEWSYGFTAGPVHVTMIDLYKTKWYGENWRETPEGQWLLAELVKAAASPWRIACFHTPIYSLGGHGKLDDEGRPREAQMRFCREQLEPLLRQHGYQLTLHGHDHVYERSTKDGLVMVTVGGGGAPLYQAGDAKQNPYSEVFRSTTHYAEFAADATTLTMTVFDAEGQQIDRVALRK